jgi:hypothetical protein
MSSTNEIMERLQKYNCVERFCILNKDGDILNNEIKEVDKKGSQNFFPDIPKLVDKAISSIRDIDPIVKIIFFVLISKIFILE